ncbi:MAG: YdiU family protein [Opitutaceae bacterium]|nr:YdiU family protein [Opitutaceae bacterium]
MTFPAAPLNDGSFPHDGWRLEHTYAGLPAALATAVAPTPVREPRLVLLNRSLARTLGLRPEAWTDAEAAALFSGNRLPPGAQPIAQAYAGHQYGHFTVLGDGRAILLGEQMTPSGERFDVQLKGAGPTPYSRRGDGRAALGPMVREYILSEAMHALGVPTTRSLAVVATGEEVWRQEAQPGAVLTRIASSHLRVGTVEWASARGDRDVLERLVAYSLQRHFPDRTDSPNPALALLDAVMERQASLVAEWMRVGFVHGVLNTDNVALSGETIDYGPCAFVDAYDPAAVFSSIDRHGRYAFGRQPAILGWNLTRLAEALLPLLHADIPQAVAVAEEHLERYEGRFEACWLAAFRRKLGLFTEEAGDAALVHRLLGWMEQGKRDYTNTFAALAKDDPRVPSVRERAEEAFGSWRQAWVERLARQPQSPEESLRLRQANCPAFIPRNHQVEAALAAAEHGDLGVLHRLLDVLATPYDHTRDAPAYQAPPQDGGVGYRTFCGT